MQVVLVVFMADGERRSYSLPRPITVIGRREDCDLRISLGEISRKHCRFLVKDDELHLEDMGSSNGTFVNGRRIQETTVQPGDRVQLGPVLFTVQIDGVPADEEIQPPSATVAGGDTDLAATPPPPDMDDDLPEAARGALSDPTDSDAPLMDSAIDDALANLDVDEQTDETADNHNKRDA